MIKYCSVFPIKHLVQYPNQLLDQLLQLWAFHKRPMLLLPRLKVHLLHLSLQRMLQRQINCPRRMLRSCHVLHNKHWAWVNLPVIQQN